MKAEVVTEGTEVCDGDAGPSEGGEEGPSPPGVCERPALREAPTAGRGKNRVMAERKYPEGSGPQGQNDSQCLLSSKSEEDFMKKRAQCPEGQAATHRHHLALGGHEGGRLLILSWSAEC